MAKILSQEEVDALLSELSADDSAAPEPAAAKEVAVKTGKKKEKIADLVMKDQSMVTRMLRLSNLPCTVNGRKSPVNPGISAIRSKSC